MMKIALIPSPEKIVYKSGFTDAKTEIKTEYDNAIPAEGFAIDIDGEIMLKASSDAGLFYARGALEQIKFQCGQRLPNVHIEDAPRFSHRSFMLDSCRHFISVCDIKRMTAYCAKLRFNIFHWHLTDDQGWFINSDFFHYYADYPYAMTPLKKVYVYNPQINENVIGVDTPIWTEYIDNIKRMEYMCFPRFIAAAQTAWSKNKPPYAVFKTEISELMPYFGIKHAAKPDE